ncbi:hypothetical protein [Nocardia sp. NPDC023988]|uniref:hypothetical protein n=1 Tax=unclassified Nocardia TaxID=2637762 RepID=UPI0033E8367F
MAYKSSPALQTWRSDRANRLDELVAAHRTVRNAGRGPQYATQQLTNQLFVALAAEFQGYCRDLHDLAILASTDGLAAPGDPRLVNARSAYVKSRRLSTGNASWSNLCNDFKAFQMILKDELEAMYPAEADDWKSVIEKLNDTRNAIAHSDQTKLVNPPDPLNLTTFRAWRSTLKATVPGLDRVVEAYLQNTIGQSW